MTNSKVVAIIVTWNGQKMVGDCLKGLLESEQRPHIMVVDNASSDGTADFVRQNYPEVEVIETGENLGYGRACNVGMRLKLQGDVDYFLLVNQDARLNSDAVGRLVTAAENHPEMGILIPLNLTSNGTQVDPDFAACLSDSRLLGYFSDLVMGQLKDAYPAGLLPGAVKLLRRKTVEQVGIYDPIFFMYGVEYDYHLRAEHHGWQSGLVPQAVIYHSYEDHRSQDQPPPTYRQRSNRLTWVSYLSLKRVDRKFIVNCFVVYGRFVLETCKALAKADFTGVVVCLSASVRTSLSIPTILKHRKISINTKEAFI